MSKLKKWGESIGDFFYYDVWVPVKDVWYDTQWFFMNLKTFWKTLWHYRDWDYEYIVDILIVLFNKLASRIEQGNEEHISASKKVAAIRSLVRELERDVDEETSLLEEKSIITRFEWGIAYDKIQKERLRNIFRLIEGQDDDEFREKYLAAQEKWKTEHGKEPNSNELYDIWVELFDGSGIGGWWE